MQTDQHGHSTPLPVEGAVFERSGTKSLVIISVLCFFWVLAAYAVAAAINKRIDFDEKTVALALYLIFAPLLMIREVRAWRARRRLIVGEDRIQVIERRRGEDHVLLQIPYANIAEFKYEDGAKRVGIDLCRLDNVDTYAPGENFERNRRYKGRHYIIPFGYQHGARAIASKMEKAYSQWHSHVSGERRSTKQAAGESEPERQIEVELIRGCRERFGSPPRRLSASDAEVCRLTLAPEIEQDFTANGDALLTIPEEQHLLRDRGRVYWGHLIQANPGLFNPKNPHTLPAYIVYTTDSFFDGRVSILDRIGTGLFALKGSSQSQVDRELWDFVRIITDERERLLRRELPYGYCGGRSVYFATCLIQPGHLPSGYIARTAFPLIVNFEETEAVMILPSRFWPPKLVSLWRDY